MYFYEVLQSIMDEKSLKVSDVSRLSGLTDSTVRSIIARKNKTVALEVAFKLARGLDVPITRLNGEDSHEKEKALTKYENAVTQKDIDIISKYHYLSPKVKELIEHVIDEEYKRWEYEQNEKEAEQNNPVKLIQFYHGLASAGNGQIVFDTLPTDKIEIPDVQSYKKADYAITVDGDSMYPEYKNRDIVIVEQTNHVEIGEIGIFIDNSKAFVKKRGHKELESVNNEYPNVSITSETQCLGRVLGKIEAHDSDVDVFKEIFLDVEKHKKSILSSEDAG